MPNFHSYRTQNIEAGQTLLVIVLIMVVALTVGLSIATRSITNTRISSDEENSQRAFSAAEAGIERSLKTSQEVSEGNKVSLDNSATYFTAIDNSPKTEIVLNGGQTVPKDEGVDLWLSDYNSDKNLIYKTPQSGTFTVWWVNSGICTDASNPPPAIEVVVLAGTTSDPSTAKASHWAFDPCSDRQSKNNFKDFVDTTTPKTITVPKSVAFDRSGSFTISNGFIARIIPLYAGTKIGVSHDSALKPQGSYITSTGSSGGTTRKITVFQQYPKLPVEIFPYAIFAP